MTPPQGEEGRSSLSLIGHTSKTFLPSRCVIGQRAPFGTRTKLPIAPRRRPSTGDDTPTHRPIGRLMWNQSALDQSESSLLTGKIATRTRVSTVARSRVGDVQEFYGLNAKIEEMNWIVNINEISVGKLIFPYYKQICVYIKCNS